MSRVIRRRQAFDDLDAIAAYLGTQSASLPDRFLDAAERTFAFLAGMPRLGSPWDSDQPNLADIPLRGYPGLPQSPDLLPPAH